MTTTTTTRQRGSRLRRSFVATAIAAVTLIGAGTAAEASAGDYSKTSPGGGWLRLCGSTTNIQCGTMGWVSGNQWVQTWCWRDDDWAGNTNRWFKVTGQIDGGGTRTGWTHASNLPVQATVPWCSSWTL